MSWLDKGLAERSQRQDDLRTKRVQAWKTALHEAEAMVPGLLEQMAERVWGRSRGRGYKGYTLKHHVNDEVHWASWRAFAGQKYHERHSDWNLGMGRPDSIIVELQEVVSLSNRYGFMVRWCANGRPSEPYGHITNTTDREKLQKVLVEAAAGFLRSQEFRKGKGKHPVQY